MSRFVRVAAVVLALGVGWGVAYCTRPAPTARVGARPAAVERAVKALDRWSPSTRDDLATALASAGPPANFDSPWREELELGALVLADDRAGIEAFASATPPSPARARARLRLALDVAGDERRAMLGRLRATYPDSAAARVYDARAGRASK